ncbi:hypothetical protein FG335_14465 [Listeria monocytogenes]|nr:hypothetical protein [Listeria monocytogenes]
MKKHQDFKPDAFLLQKIEREGELLMENKIWNRDSLTNMLKIGDTSNETTDIIEGEIMGQYLIKTIHNGWIRLENYCDCSVVSIKEFQGVCVTITNFMRFSIHSYSMDDIEKDKGDWRYIFGEKLLEQVNGEDELQLVLEKYHLTDVEIAEVINFDFDDRSSESYDLQAEWVRKNTDSLDCLSSKTFWYWTTA